jgi:hypothetical protein
MCSSNIITATAVAGGLTVGGPAGAAVAAGTVRSIQGKRIVGGDIIPKPVKATPQKPPPDLTGAEKRRQFRATQRTLAGRPGPGRIATQFTTPGSLKTKTGQ